MSGTVEKEGKLRWSSRWLVLQAGRLVVLRLPTSAVPLHVLPLDDNVRVTVGRGAREGSSFTVVTRQRGHTFRTVDADGAEAWASALREECVHRSVRRSGAASEASVYGLAPTVEPRAEGGSLCDAFAAMRQIESPLGDWPGERETTASDETLNDFEMAVGRTDAGEDGAAAQRCATAGALTVSTGGSAGERAEEAVLAGACGEAGGGGGGGTGAEGSGVSGGGDGGAEEVNAPGGGGASEELQEILQEELQEILQGFEDGDEVLPLLPGLAQEGVEEGVEEGDEGGGQGGDEAAGTTSSAGRSAAAAVPAVPAAPNALGLLLAARAAFQHSVLRAAAPPPPKSPAAPLSVKQHQLASAVSETVAELSGFPRRASALPPHVLTRVSELGALSAVLPLPKSLGSLVEEATEWELSKGRGAVGNAKHARASTGVTGALRTLVSKEKRRFAQDGFNLDLSYITPRVIAMGFPSEGTEAAYRNPMSQVVSFLERRHREHYLVYNLCSERSYDPKHFGNRVKIFPFDDHNPPPLRMMPQLCASVAAWHDEHPDNVAVVHCKAGKGRTGTMISAALLHRGDFRSADDALAFYGFARTNNCEGVTIASQRLYVHYYARLCREPAACERLLDRQAACRLVRVRLVTLPIGVSEKRPALCIKVTQHVPKTAAWRSEAGAVGWVPASELALADGDSEGPPPPPKWRSSDAPMAPLVFSSAGKLIGTRPDVPVVDVNTKSCPLLLSSDVRVEVSHRASGQMHDDKLFSFWFNAAMLSKPRLVLSKWQLDGGAGKDAHHKRYNPHFRVELDFAPARLLDRMFAQPT
ncbi:hypothetical protein EMIHUDRAFT_437207 [Emiliania huxleyi CCMP1516]|uniref:Phosphatidylinositol-3,4,5-trisphosphate 3-phosphatase n=2 Tax=Emiliania huxleyi TaxID=2903 RepID=A0A0D3IPK8_EMIH1|nr:hypothetical protein EMIHUDRAFT_437207 [Emiliania huxleyi CCMP1516]EOD13193.1 hypothetical protein EMIHUDRAFT_437207 [Emiliania huxleyi CCMP1516]|eukprot:XP_005765622.1 hypothetical protein EMIHUDRAFT_437207 [Emiliania huxleyi CCMP1516]